MRRRDLTQRRKGAKGFARGGGLAGLLGGLGAVCGLGGFAGDGGGG